MNSSDLRDRAARLRALSETASDQKTRDDLLFLAGEYEAAADEDVSAFTVSTIFPR